MKQHMFNAQMSRVFNFSSFLSGGGNSGGGSSSGGGGSGGGNTSSSTSPRSSHRSLQDNSVNILKRGYLKKYKSMKNRYFVLYKQSESGSPARLVYYETEQKFLDQCPPKRQYLLNQSIQWEEKVDNKKPHSVTLVIKQDTCCVTASSHNELEDWLSAIVEAAKTSHWEHSWDVEVMQRGIGGLRSGSHLVGSRQLNLTKSQLSLTKQDGVTEPFYIPLNVIRNVSCSLEFFEITLGKMAPKGSGTLSLKTLDANIAENIHTIVSKAMKESNVVTIRDRTSSMSIAESSMVGHRNRSDSLPSRPASVGDHHPPHPSCHDSGVRLVNDGRGGLMLWSMNTPPPPDLMIGGGGGGACSNNRPLPPHQEGGSDVDSNSYVPIEPQETNDRDIMSTTDDGPVSWCSDSIPSSSIVSPVNEQPYMDMTRGCGGGASSSMSVSPPVQIRSPPRTPRSTDPHHPTLYQQGPDYINADHHMFRSSSSPASASTSLDVRVGSTPSQPKPIPGNSRDCSEMSPSSVCSSINSCTGTPCSSDHHHHHHRPCSVSSSSHHHHAAVLLDSTDDTNMHEDSSTEDTNDDRARTCADDMDIDMDIECDQVDGSLSARSCLDAPFLQAEHQRHSMVSSLDEEQRPLRTSSLGSKPDISRRKNSAPMLGIPCPSTSWSDSSPSYFSSWFKTHGGQEGNIKHKQHMLMDFTKKSCDHLASSSSQFDDSGKDKKSLSFERIKNTFSTKRKSKRVSEGDSTAYRGRAIEIPTVQSADYFSLDLNPSPRSNNSGGSDAPSAGTTGYLPMRPGISNSLSSTGSSEYVPMNSSRSVGGGIHGSSLATTTAGSSSGYCDDGYMPMASPRSSLDSSSVTAMDVSDNNNGYVCMTQGSTPDSASSRYSHQQFLLPQISSDLPSPQEESSPTSYLHEVDKVPKEKKKFGKRGKESIKRKKSDPSAGESIANAFKSKSSGHFSTISAILTRKNSQNSSSHKTPLSPTGSPLPKSSRSSNSPFASLGRSKSKEGRNNEFPPSSVSPTRAGGSFTRTIKECSSSASATDGDSYCAMDNLEVLGSNNSTSTSSFPRNLSNRELQSGVTEPVTKPLKRSSGSFETGFLLMLSPQGTSEQQQQAPQLSSRCAAGGGTGCYCESHQSSCFGGGGGGGSNESSMGAYVNLNVSPTLNVGNNVSSRCSSQYHHSHSSNSAFLNCNNVCNCTLHQCLCRHNVDGNNLGQIGHQQSSAAADSCRHHALMSRLSSQSSGVNDDHRQDNSGYLNMCPTSNRTSDPAARSQSANASSSSSVKNTDGSILRPNSASASSSNNRSSDISSHHSIKTRDRHTLSSTISTLPSAQDRKILNTDLQSPNSSNYLPMDMGRLPTVSSTPSPSPTTAAPINVTFSSSSSQTTSPPAVVKKPALPPLLLERPDPSVPLERLTLAEGQPLSAWSSQQQQQQPQDTSFNPPVCSCATCSSSSSTGERCRSHSGPGAPEGSSLCSSSKDSESLSHRSKEDDMSRTLSASNSPVSYSPPTSPHLASSSKSSLSEGGLSSASSTCTVVNVGLRLQQNRKSHASGSSSTSAAENNSHTLVPCAPICSTVLHSLTDSPALSGASTIAPLTDAIAETEVEAAVSSCDTLRAPPVEIHKEDVTLTVTTTNSSTSSSTKEEGSSDVKEDRVVYATLDLTPPTSRDVSSRSSASNSPSSARRTPSQQSRGSLTIDEDDSTPAPPTSSNYTEIDFERSESLRNASLIRDALRN